jgi:hypothetical protein
MRTRTVLLLTFLFMRSLSQTKTSGGLTTVTVCTEMKKNCKPGKIVDNKRTRIADTTVVYIDGYVCDITGKKLQSAFFKFIDQKTNKTAALLTTDSAGRMRVSGFNAGTYTLKINCFGYQEFVAKDLKLGPGDMRKIIVDMGEYCCTKTELKETDIQSQVNELEKKWSEQK